MFYGPLKHFYRPTLHFTHLTLWCPNKADSQLVFSDDSGQQVTSDQNLLNTISASGKFPSVEPPKPTQHSVKVHVLSSAGICRHLTLVSTHIGQWCRHRLDEGGKDTKSMSVWLAAASGTRGLQRWLWRVLVGKRGSRLGFWGGAPFSSQRWCVVLKLGLRGSASSACPSKESDLVPSFLRSA